MVLIHKQIYYSTGSVSYFTQVLCFTYTARHIYALYNTIFIRRIEWMMAMPAHVSKENNFLLTPKFCNGVQAIFIPKCGRGNKASMILCVWVLVSNWSIMLFMWRNIYFLKREKNRYFESGFQILHVYFPIICLFDIMTVDFKTLYPIWSNVWLHNVLKRERELETLKNVTLIRNSDDKLRVMNV